MDPGEPQLSRAKSRLAARTRELDLIQSLARRAAEARTPDELFLAAVTVLQRSEDLDAAVVAFRLDRIAEIRAFLSRPLSESCLSELVHRAGAVLGWDPLDRPEPRQLRMSAYDEQRGARRGFQAEELVVIPVLRREAAVACLLVLPSRKVEEDQLRLLDSAGNQLSLHLDRILAAREAEADRFRSILDSMPQAVLLASNELRVLQSNPAARQLFDQLRPGLSSGLDELVDRLGLREAVDRVRSGASTIEEIEITPDRRVLNVTVSSLAAEAGAGGLVLVLSDATERRRLQNQLAQSEKMSSLGQMISGVAHELNNPLASILGYAQLIGANPGDAKLPQRVDVLQTEARRCQRIVQNLLSFARQHEPERKPLSLNDVVRSVLGLMGYQLRVNGIEVETELDPDVPSLNGDTHQLQQALVNLLTNAQQAIRSCAESGRVTVRTARNERGEATLEVADSGPGVDSAIRERIFDPFFSTKAEGEGTGLGLSLVYGIVAAHGGGIEVAPGEGTGARFVVSLPLAQLSARNAERPRVAKEDSSVSAARVLIVEDEPALARLIEDVLAEDGHSALIARDGHEALKLLDGNRVELVISDLKMPRMSGEELHRELCARHPALARRMLLTTGDTVGDATRRFVREHDLPLVRKPFDLDRLRKAVRDRLRESH